MQKKKIELENCMQKKKIELREGTSPPPQIRQVRIWSRGAPSSKAKSCWCSGAK